MAFLFRVNWRHGAVGRTDWRTGAALNAAFYEGLHDK